jgi:uncharacterized protein (TIGR03086 family)
MTAVFEGIVDRFIASSSGFERVLAGVSAGLWERPTPCTEWDVRRLVNHVTQGNANYIRLLGGASGAEFLRWRNADALGADPHGAYERSVRECSAAFARPGALDLVLDYPLGRVTGRQALAVRTTDTLIHTWDLARALGVDDTLDADLVAWAGAHLDEIYRGLAETPADPATTHRFFAAEPGGPCADATPQNLLLRRMGRDTEGRAPETARGRNRGPAPVDVSSRG